MPVSLRHEAVGRWSTWACGFTFVELLLSVSILAVIVAGIEEMFIMSSVLGDLSTNTSLAVIEARSKLETIHNTDFSSIVANFSAGGSPGNMFDTASLRGKGLITIDDADPLLFKVTVQVCFLNKNGRVIGEDKNLNGMLDSGEDENGNGMLDSPVSLMTYIAKR